MRTPKPFPWWRASSTDRLCKTYFAHLPLVNACAGIANGCRLPPGPTACVCHAFFRRKCPSPHAEGICGERMCLPPVARTPRKPSLVSGFQMGRLRLGARGRTPSLCCSRGRLRGVSRHEVGSWLGDVQRILAAEMNAAGTGEKRGSERPRPRKMTANLADTPSCSSSPEPSGVARTAPESRPTCVTWSPG
jgi:hypothetical protein